jgi:hypothetical protein
MLVLPACGPLSDEKLIEVLHRGLWSPCFLIKNPLGIIFRFRVRVRVTALRELVPEPF